MLTNNSRTDLRSYFYGQRPVRRSGQFRMPGPVLMRPAQPVLFLNDGRGRFTLVPQAFRFASAPQGSFTSVSAADYDRDGRLDLYLCTYVYFQSEAQYRYPAPYHDAQNRPLNLLFRNRLDRDPPYFEDMTPAKLNRLLL